MLTARGAGIVACADLACLPSDVRRGLPCGVCIGVPLSPEIIAQIGKGPTRRYATEYERVNTLLNQLCVLCAEFLTEAGHRAVAVKATVSNDELDRNTLSTVFPHKTIARLAGVGWIGKCALLVTKQFGSAVRYSTVLTNAPLPTGTPADLSECGDCNVCVAICPAHAPTGRTWQPGMDREDLLDAHACCEAARRQSLGIGFDGTICGRCIAACPHTRAYLRRCRTINYRIEI
jgi:epoxyqueuosine reductase QueG